LFTTVNGLLPGRSLPANIVVVDFQPMTISKFGTLSEPQYERRPWRAFIPYSKVRVCFLLMKILYWSSNLTYTVLYETLSRNRLTHNFDLVRPELEQLEEQPLAILAAATGVCESCSYLLRRAPFSTEISTRLEELVLRIRPFSASS
jgi:hypothetical protein